MSKRDEKDETPIQFYIPGPGNRTQIPRSINQPNRIYKNSGMSKPGHPPKGWLFCSNYL
jgi:hypothetical protein